MNLTDQIRRIPEGSTAIREWLSDGTIVEQEVAQKRADICKGCQFNVTGNKAIGMIADGARKLLEWKSKVGIRVDGEKSLGVCDICGCVLRLQVHEPGELLKLQVQRNGEIFPAHCWKTEL